MSEKTTGNSSKDQVTTGAEGWARNAFNLETRFPGARKSAFACLAEAAVAVLNCANSKEKAKLSLIIAADWKAGTFHTVGQAVPPGKPAREEQPLLVPPRDVPRRKINRDPKTRATLLHALCHIELHAINLCWDIIARFSAMTMPRAFYDDWVMIAEDEARHHLMLCERLEELGSFYGAMPAHDGLWQAADATKQDLRARLAIVPMVLEARGLDVTPGMIDKLSQAEDDNSVARLNIIYEEEITHVSRGKGWFDQLCADEGSDPVETWQALVLKYFKGGVKSPFNIEARNLADFPIDFYGPIADLHGKDTIK